MKQYEAMFLFDPAFSAEFGKVKEEIVRILDRADAEVVFLEKWDERKLAYDINGRKRGLYVLTFFKCSGEKVAGIERDVQLSEAILRLLITTAEGVTPELMMRHIPQRAMDEKKERAAAEKMASAEASSEKDVPEAAAAEVAPTAAAPELGSEAAVAVAEAVTEPEVEEKKAAEGDAPAADQPAE